MALDGDLGAGKTALARTVLEALGVREEVPSPTFTLVQRYETPALIVSHFDLYRIKQESELDELGFDDALAEGAALIEWPERAPHRIPDDALHVHLAIVGNTARRATLSGSPRWMEMLRMSERDAAIRDFLKSAGWGDAVADAVAGRCLHAPLLPRGAWFAQGDADGSAARRGNNHRARERDAG